MNGIKSEKGQALILIALGVVALIGFTALAVDGGRVFSDRRNAQNAADTAALQAALAKIRQENYVQKAEQRASSNGYENDTDSTVTVILCSQAPADDPCKITLPTGASLAEYIRVTITSDVPMTFARVLGRTVVTNKVEAITRVQGSTSSGGIFGTAGMYATSSANHKDCFHFNGGSQVYMHNTGIYSNCPHAESIILDGGTKLTLESNGETAGCWKPNGAATIVGTIDCNGTSTVFDADSFANVPGPQPKPTCSTQGGQSTSNNITTFTPGYFNGNVSVSSAVFTHGTYCFNGGLNINGGGSINQKSGDSGTVRFVMGGALIVPSGSNNYFKDFEYYTTNDSLTFSGSFTADRFRFFATGTGDLKINGTAYFKSDDAFIYSYRGMFNPNSGPTVILHAPSEGIYKGLLIYLPWNQDDIHPNTLKSQSNMLMNGGINSMLTGTILAPSKNIQPNGGANTVIHGQLIGYEFMINGNHTLDIWYDPAENYGAPADPTIELTK